MVMFIIFNSCINFNECVWRNGSCFGFAELEEDSCVLSLGVCGFWFLLEGGSEVFWECGEIIAMNDPVGGACMLMGFNYFVFG